MYSNELAGAQGLGITEAMWNCHVNHYTGLWWEDIERYGYDQYFIALGWTVDSWDNGAHAPETEDLYWDELTPEQRAAATQLCYTREVWDSVPISDWA